jgi:hypothetical protein
MAWTEVLGALVLGPALKRPLTPPAKQPERGRHSSCWLTCPGPGGGEARALAGGAGIASSPRRNAPGAAVRVCAICFKNFASGLAGPRKSADLPTHPRSVPRPQTKRKPCGSADPLDWVCCNWCFGFVMPSAITKLGSVGAAFLRGSLPNFLGCSLDPFPFAIAIKCHQKSTCNSAGSSVGSLAPPRATPRLGGAAVSCQYFPCSFVPALRAPGLRLGVKAPPPAPR